MDDVVMPWAFGDTRMALDHSLTHSLTHPLTHSLTYLHDMEKMRSTECERAIEAGRCDFLQRN